MLKKISGLNNQELAEFLGKSRNTITAWEKDETIIPETEKRKLNEKFNILPFYWNIGLNESDETYKMMYQTLKLGFELEKNKRINNKKDPVERILDICDSISNDDDQNNDFKHFHYIQSLSYMIDPITNKKIDKNHFINDDIVMKNLLNLYKSIDNYYNNQNVEDININVLEILKDWRSKKALEEGKKNFQILSDAILEDIAKNYENDNDPFSKEIKNFPKNGIKYKMYAEEIKELLYK